jgi:hypothetical protein
VNIVFLKPTRPGFELFQSDALFGRMRVRISWQILLVHNLLNAMRFVAVLLCNVISLLAIFLKLTS